MNWYSSDLSLSTVISVSTVCEVPGVDRTPPFEQIAEHYRAAIREGRLTVGSELPSTRRLASEWGVAAATAQRALELLRSEGWIETRPGKVPVVAELPEGDD